MNRELYKKLLESQMTNRLYNMEETRKKLEHYLDKKYEKALYIKGETICNEGMVADKIYFLERGKVIIVRKDSDQNEYSGGYLMPGEFFGLSSIISAPEEACLKALTNCSIYVISASDVRELIEKQEDLKKLLINILVDTIRIRTVRQGNMIGGGCRTSFVNFILEHIEGFGKLDDEENVVVNLDVNLIEIAQILNMTRETLSRIVSEMKRQGIINTRRRYIKILDMKRFIA